MPAAIGGEPVADRPAVCGPCHSRIVTAPGHCACTPRYQRHCLCHTRQESDRAKRAHGGVKNEKFAEIVLIYAGSERSELASDSAKLVQFIAAVFDAFLRSRPWFCPRKPRACQPVAGVAGCSVASGDLCCRFQAPLCSRLSPLCLAGPLPLRISLHQLPLLLSPASPSCSGPCSHCCLVAQRGGITAPKCSRTTSRKRSCVMVPLFAALSALQKRSSAFAPRLGQIPDKRRRHRRPQPRSAVRHKIRPLGGHFA